MFFFVLPAVLSRVELCVVGWDLNLYPLVAGGGLGSYRPGAQSCLALPGSCPRQEKTTILTSYKTYLLLTTYSNTEQRTIVTQSSSEPGGMSHKISLCSKA